MINQTKQEQKITLSAVLIKKNGDIINLGVIAKSKENSNGSNSSNKRG
jgi:hypothetical protein